MIFEDTVFTLFDTIGVGATAFIGAALLSLPAFLLVAATPIMTVSGALAGVAGTAIGTGLVNFILHDLLRIEGSL